MAPRGREGSIADLRCGQPVPHPSAHREPSPSATHKPFRVQPRGLTLPALSLQLRPHPFLRALRPLFPPGPAASNPGPPKSLQSRKAGPAARVASAQVPPAPSPHPPQRQPSPPFPCLPQPPRRPPRLPRLLAAGKMRYAALPQTRPARDPLRVPAAPTSRAPPRSRRWLAWVSMTARLRLAPASLQPPRRREGVPCSDSHRQPQPAYRVAEASRRGPTEGQKDARTRSSLGQSPLAEQQPPQRRGGPGGQSSAPGPDTWRAGANPARPASALPPTPQVPSLLES